MMYLEKAAMKLQKHINLKSPRIGAVEIELLILLLPIILSMVQDCIRPSSDEEEVERRAYKYVTRRGLFDWLFARRTELIRINATDEWIKLGGDLSVALDVGISVEVESRNLDRIEFHNLWEEAKKQHGWKRKK